MKIGELAKELNVHHLKIVHTRRKGFPDAKGDLTEEQVLYICSRFKEDMNKKEETHLDKVQLPPPPERVVITHNIQGSKFVECMSNNRKGRHKLLLPHGTSNHFPRGKVTYASLIDYDGLKIFVHSSVVEKYWRPLENV